MKLNLPLLVVSLSLLCSCDESPVATELSATTDATVASSEQLVGASGSEVAKLLEDADHGGRPLSADLSGENEVPGPGDPDGSGTALITLNQGQGEVCFELTVADIASPVAAHIHDGDAGVAGPVVIALLPPPEDGTVASCVSDVDRDLIKDIRQSPADYYVNVHNADFPPGAVRGQLTK